MSYSTMAVIPMDEYTQLQSLLKSRSPLDSQLKTLTQTYHHHEGVVDPQERSIQQGQDMFRIQHLKEKMRSHLNSVTPKPYRARADQLLRFLDPIITFNEHGELINRSVGTPILGSRIDDLIQHAVRDKRRQFTPVGWSDFVKILHDKNTPKMLLNQPTISEMDGSFLVRPSYGRRALSPKSPPKLIKRKPTSRAVKREVFDASVAHSSSHMSRSRPPTRLYVKGKKERSPSKSPFRF